MDADSSGERRHAVGTAGGRGDCRGTDEIPMLDGRCKVESGLKVGCKGAWAVAERRLGVAWSWRMEGGVLGLMGGWANSFQSRSKDLLKDSN